MRPKPKSTLSRIAAALAALLAAAAAAPAMAACFESGVGCTDDHYISRKALNALSCDALWTVRNTIYHENGYCFRTARGRAAFSNENCRFDDVADVRLNSFERANIARVLEAERKKGCN
jgi:hypothetical protein